MRRKIFGLARCLHASLVCVCGVTSPWRSCSRRGLLPTLLQVEHLGRFVGWSSQTWAHLTCDPLPASTPADVRAAVSKIILFEQFVRELQCVRLGGLPRKSMLAFFLNVYNAMVEHGLLRYGVPVDRKGVQAFRESVVYRIGHIDFSLDAIYHIVLRGNERPPDAWTPRTSSSDIRASFNTRPEPFAVLLRTDAVLPLCGADEILTFSARGFSRQSTEAVVRFCERNVHVDVRNGKVCLPRVFQESWDAYGSSDQAVIEWLAEFVPALHTLPASSWRVVWPDASYGRA
jgi:hypothetical protein